MAGDCEREMTILTLHWILMLPLDLHVTESRWNVATSTPSGRYQLPQMYDVDLALSYPLYIPWTGHSSVLQAYKRDTVNASQNPNIVELLSSADNPLSIV